MNKLTASKAILLAAGVLALLLGSRQQRLAQKSFVRAVLLEPCDTGCTVGLLYQDVAASADASEAGEQLRIVAAQGRSLAEAFDAAERKLPESADYKLCDYTILCGAWNVNILRQYEEMLLSESTQGRLSASLYACDETIGILAESAEQFNGFTADWMDALVRQKALCPRLYGISQPAVVLPLLTVEDAMPGRQSEGALLLCTDGLVQKLDENAAQILWLLLERGGQRKFLLDDTQLVLERCRMVHMASTDRVCVRVEAVINAGNKDPEQIAAQIETLAKKTLAACGDAGWYLLGMNAVNALAGNSAREGSEVGISVHLTQ